MFATEGKTNLSAVALSHLELGSSIKNVAGKDVAEKMKVGVVLLLEKDAQLPELVSSKKTDPILE